MIQASSLPLTTALVRHRRASLPLGLASVLLLSSLSTASEAADLPAGYRDTATVVDYIRPDPLNGNNGLPTSPAAPLVHGPINIAVDTNGNAIEAVDEQDIDYFDGHYYIYGQSFSCGAFNYAPGVPYDEVLRTTTPSFYRWCGVVTYKSKDLENWELVSRWYPQDPATGRFVIVKKPRVAYAAATGKYVMWFLNPASVSGDDGVKLMVGDSPTGPWGPPISPKLIPGVSNADLNHDFQIQTDPKTGYTWMVQAGGGGVNLFRLTPDLLGVAQDVSFQVKSYPTGTGGLSGGIGLSHYNGWWYITGSPTCGNCVATKFSYLMARDPQGPWMSPDDMSTTQPLVPAVLSETTQNSQSHGAVMLPDMAGGHSVMIWGTHYRSSPTGAPLSQVVYNNSGDNNLALSGQWWFPLRFAQDGRILPLEDKASYQIPLAQPVNSQHAPAFQADLSITSTSSATQSWTLRPGTHVAAVLPSVFQLTPDLSPASNKWVTQAPLVDAPLEAKLTLPDGSTHTWSVDARQVSWSPRWVPLNLPAGKTFPQGGTVTLTLSTKATNGGYGVAVGQPTPAMADAVYTRMTNAGRADIPGTAMHVKTSASASPAPRITRQPRSVTVAAGSKVGFLVDAVGEGLGFQWYRNGQIVQPEGGLNESASAAFRLANVSDTVAGEYVATVSNTAGSVTSDRVRLTVVPAICANLLAAKAAVGSRTGDARYNTALDTDGSGLIDIRDVAAAARALPAGTACQ